MPKKETATTLSIDGREVRVSNPDKPYFSGEVKLSKLDVIGYYLSVSDGAVAGIRDRPSMLKRFVDGAESPPFYQKRAPDNRPGWLRLSLSHFHRGARLKKSSSCRRAIGATVASECLIQCVLGALRSRSAPGQFRTGGARLDLAHRGATRPR